MRHGSALHRRARKADGRLLRLSQGPRFPSKFEPKEQTRAGFSAPPGSWCSKGCLNFGELRAKRCKSHQAGGQENDGHAAVRNAAGYGIRREGEG